MFAKVSLGRCTFPIGEKFNDFFHIPNFDCRNREKVHTYTCTSTFVTCSKRKMRSFCSFFVYFHQKQLSHNTLRIHGWLNCHMSHSGTVKTRRPSQRTCPFHPLGRWVVHISLRPPRYYYITLAVIFIKNQSKYKSTKFRFLYNNNNRFGRPRLFETNIITAEFNESFRSYTCVNKSTRNWSHLLKCRYV